MPTRPLKPEELAPEQLVGGPGPTLPVGSVADPTLGIGLYLKAHTEVNAATEGRIYRPELPGTADPNMPQGCLIVRPTGGGSMFGRDYLGFLDSRVDITCYGSTRLESENIARMVQLALKELTHGVWEGVVLRWARIAGATSSAIDPQTNWPFAVVVAQVMHALRTVE